MRLYFGFFSKFLISPCLHRFSDSHGTYLVVESKSNGGYLYNAGGDKLN